MLRYHVSVAGKPLCQSSISGSVVCELEGRHIQVTCAQGSIEQATRLADALKDYGYPAKAEGYPCPVYYRAHKR